jgi:hypothetical protein
LFAARLAIHRQRFEREVAVVAVQLAGSEIRPIEEHLQARSSFNVRWCAGILCRRALLVLRVCGDEAGSK